jgi:hypothetical protein
MDATPTGRYAVLAMSELVEFLPTIDQHDPSAAGPLLYDEPCKRAAQRLLHQEAGQISNSSALLRNAAMRMIVDQQFPNRMATAVHRHGAVRTIGECACRMQLGYDSKSNISK